MRRNTIVPATLLLCTVWAGAAQAQQTATQQSSPRIRRVVELVEVMNQREESRVIEYLRGNVTPAAQSTSSAGKIREAAAAFGSLRVLNVEPVQPGVARARLITQRGDTVAMIVGIEQAEPYRILRLELPEGTALVEAAGAGAASAAPVRPSVPSVPAPAAPLARAEAADHLDRFMTVAARQNDFAGAVLVSHNGVPVYRKGFGPADRERNLPVTPETRFSVGSINKMFTAVAIAQLVEQGKLSYQDPLSKFLPDYPNREDAARIRVEHLLTHTSGLGDYFTERFFRERPRAVDRLVDISRENANLAFAPGSNSQYSNTGYVLLGAIIEKVSGMDYYDYVTKHVFERAGMANTVFPRVGEQVPHAAIRYGRRPDEREWQQFDVSPASPAGSALSTVDDLMRFGEALRTGRLVSVATLTLMSTPRPDLGAPGYGYGMRTQGQGPRTIGHNGGSPGVHAHFQMFPDHGYVYVMLTTQTLMGIPASNQYVADRLDEVARALIARR